MSDIVKNINDILTCRINKSINYVREMNLVYLPEQSMQMQALLEQNINHRKLIEDEIEKQSMMVEKATVELIGIFINLVNIEPLDKNGQRIFRVPREQVNDDNWKTEFKYPIDKFDWLTFEKIFQQVFQYPDSKREQMCKQNG